MATDQIVGAAASGGLAAAGSAAATGMPPAIVVGWAVIGGLVAVWLGQKQDVTITVAWAIQSLIKMLLSALVGIAGSAILLAVAPAYELTKAAALVPHWAVAFSIAALAFRVGPVMFSFIGARFGIKPTAPGGDDAAA